MKTGLMTLVMATMAFGVAINKVDYHPIKQLIGERPADASNKRNFGQLEEEKDPEFWNALAREELTKRLGETYNFKMAKNVLFFLGDGMSLSTVAASRILKGQQKGKPGEEELLSFEKFPHTGFSKVSM